MENRSRLCGDVVGNELDFGRRVRILSQVDYFERTARPPPSSCPNRPGTSFGDPRMERPRLNENVFVGWILLQAAFRCPR